MLKKFERYPLTFGPTHIEKLERLTAHLGGGAGGRRDTEKSGRSRVTESEFMGIRERGLAPGGGCRGSGFSAATNCRCPPVEPIRSKSRETTASCPSAPHAEKEKTAAINQAQRLIIYPPAVALDADCEFRTGLRRVPLDETPF